jgi:hypothetical protein
MPITTSGGVISETAPAMGALSLKTFVFSERDLAVCAYSNTLKQVQFDVVEGDATAAVLTLSCTVTGAATLHLTNLQTTSAGYVGIGIAPTTALHTTETKTITGTVADGVSAAISIDPVYAAATAQTVTRHNYIVATQVDGGANATISDACLVRFPAAAGTHKAVAAATTKTTPGGVDAWVKINVNGTIMYMPAYISKTA